MYWISSATNLNRQLVIVLFCNLFQVLELPLSKLGCGQLVCQLFGHYLRAMKNHSALPSTSLRNVNEIDNKARLRPVINPFPSVGGRSHAKSEPHARRFFTLELP